MIAKSTDLNKSLPSLVETEVPDLEYFNFDDTLKPNCGPANLHKHNL